MAKPSRWTAARRWRRAAISISCATGPTPNGKKRGSRSRRRTRRIAPQGSKSFAPRLKPKRGAIVFGARCRQTPRQNNTPGGDMAALREPAPLADMVRALANSRGSEIAFEFEGRRTSFAELDVLTNRVANALIALGVRRHERIAYLGKNSDVYFELLLGAMKANVVMAPVNWRLAGPEVAFIVGDCKAPVLFVGPEFIAQARNIKAQLPDLRHVITTEGGAPEWPDFTAWRDAQSGDDPKIPIGRKDIAIQLYTSGTTGKPKGAMLSHANFLNLVQTGNEAEKPEWNRWSTEDVSLVAMPIFHIGGSGWGVVGLYHGGKGVIAGGFDPR